jgi:hypothetical protein
VSAGGFSHAMYAVPAESTATAGVEGRPDAFEPIAIGFEIASAPAVKPSIGTPVTTQVARNEPRQAAGNLTEQFGDGKRRACTFSERSFRVELSGAAGATDHDVRPTRTGE